MSGSGTSLTAYPTYFRTFSWVFVAIALLELISNLLFDYLPLLHYLVKPLIMISLSVYYFYQNLYRQRLTYLLMQGALLFSLMGDIFLMFEGELFFVLGLGAFLIAQGCYMGVFYRVEGQEKAPNPLLTRKPWLILPLVAYAIGLLWLLGPALGDMQLPVLLYALALSGMVLLALNRWRRVIQVSFAYVFLGALLFLISDSMIAVEKFGQEILPIPWAKLWIMITYMAAQYLIVMGIMIEHQVNRR